MWQISIRFHFFFEMVVIDAWCRYFVELLSRLVCQLTISFHTLLCIYEDFERMAISLLHPRKFAIQTWFCNCAQYLCLFGIVLECSTSFRDQGMMLVLPNLLPASDRDFSFQPILCHPQTQIRIILFLPWTKRHYQFGLFSQPCFKRIFPNCLSHNGPAKGWPYRYLSRGKTGSSILHHDFGRRIQVSGHSDLGFFDQFVSIFHFPG